MTSPEMPHVPPSSSETPDNPAAPPVSRRPAPPRANLAVFGAAVGLAVIAHALVEGAGAGLNVTLIVLGIVGTVLGLSRARRLPRAPEGLGLLTLAGVFALLFALRDSPLLGFVNAFALLAALSLGLVTLRTPGLARGSVLRHVLGFVESGVTTAVGGVLLTSAVPWATLSTGKGLRGAGPVLGGLLLATPIVLVFGALLGAADAAFANLTAQLFDWEVERLADDLIAILAWWWVLGGLLVVALLIEPWHHRTSTDGLNLTLGVTQIVIVLGSVALLFTLFVGVQFAYLFGGQDQVTTLTGLTYAEYARGGFFELVTVAALVLPLLLAAHGLAPREARHGTRLLALNLAVVLLVGVMLVSAWRRMMLYVGAYGLTEDRVLAVTFMLWVGLTLAWFVVTLFRRSVDRFAFVALLLGFGAVGSLNVLDPARLIVNVNLDRAARPQDGAARLDVAHLAHVGADAVPTLVRRLDELSIDDRELLLDKLREGHADEEHLDWRAWNVSRSRARALLQK